MTDDTENTQKETVLVLGGTGKSGRRVAERLRARGARVRIGSRRAETPFDWERPETWPAVVSGARSAYVAYSPDVGFPGASEAVGAFAELAVREGVRRLVLLSGRGEPGARRSEEALFAAGAPAASVVRASFFAQNFSEGFFAGMIRSGTVVFPAEGVAEPFIDAVDIADVAVEALTGDPGRHAGRVHEVTGPRALTFPEAVGEISAAAGREIAYVPLSFEAFRGGMVEQGAPPEFAARLTELFGEILDGRNSAAADGVRTALGREATAFSEYAKRTAATGVWNPS
ncbi:NmrA family transcriptional regulator [Nocardiopsis sp. CNT-189]|uniref:NmrA family transcriptional regulator n=1 Tax=Nocardiopsis oceanisediminis TaxID=2816862 RepID=UPI003B2F0E1D